MPYTDSENAKVLLIATIILSFVIASSLNVYPLSPSMAALRPMVMIMVLIFGCYSNHATLEFLRHLPSVSLLTYF